MDRQLYRTNITSVERELSFGKQILPSFLLTFNLSVPSFRPQMHTNISNTLNTRPSNIVLTGRTKSDAVRSAGKPPDSVAHLRAFRYRSQLSSGDVAAGKVHTITCHEGTERE
jgi:hypothetical protein